MTFLIVGDANADLSASLGRFPHEGDDSPIAALMWGGGGSAANVAAALALLGAPVRLLARVGSDPAAALALRVPQTAGVDLTLVQHDASLATGLCFAAISPSGERTFFSYRGANVALELTMDAATMLEGAHWLHIAGHALLEGTQRVTALVLIEEAGRRGIPVSLDLCLPLLRERRDELSALMPRLRVLFANDLELAALFPGQSQEAALAQIIGQGVGLAALKRGRYGCVIAGVELCYSAPAFPIQAIDTTGSGDAFVAGFLYGYLRAGSPATCAILANAIGALAASQPGAAEALPERRRLRAFLAGHPSAGLLDDP
jgi:sugar/nucleoside kinase (ribokinase family)